MQVSRAHVAELVAVLLVAERQATAWDSVVSAAMLMVKPVPSALTRELNRLRLVLEDAMVDAPPD